jgi:hypothetical protein
MFRDSIDCVRIAPGFAFFRINQSGYVFRGTVFKQSAANFRRFSSKSLLDGQGISKGSSHGAVCARQGRQRGFAQLDFRIVPIEALKDSTLLLSKYSKIPERTAGCYPDYWWGTAMEIVFTGKIAQSM